MLSPSTKSIGSVPFAGFKTAVGEPTKLAIVTSKPIEPSLPPFIVTSVGETFKTVASGIKAGSEIIISVSESIKSASS
ncbi:hypothetical protein HEPPS_05930 [Candidatus Hepatoplasma crinochetorum]|uniref:Uncharacterized protein n=1 Tax=Candidatus Hepatoplasma crinochetorum TaxID=295596 RepID=A0A0G7ZMD7_9MOLU|nr:hypothetical protein HEPPS_05930 [Candidatus Hepatoplasma crinochetorum]